MGKRKVERKERGLKRARNAEIRFQVTVYDRSDIDTQIMDRAQAMAMDLKSYDCCRATRLETHGFRDHESGEWINFGEGKSQGVIGPTCSKLLEAIQWTPGVFLDPSMLYECTGEESLIDGANMAARIHSLRKAFGETKETENFILTSDGGVAWPQELTWVSVEIFIPVETDAAAVIGS